MLSFQTVLRGNIKKNGNLAINQMETFVSILQNMKKKKREL